MEAILSCILSTGLSQSDLARLAGVSRQAVSKWLKPGNKGLRLSTLQNLSLRLGMSVDLLIRPIEYDLKRGSSFSEAVQSLESQFLWDRLYPSLEAFVGAIACSQKRAIARLVEEVGLLAAKKIAGKQVIERFLQYQKYIKPERRKEIFFIWKIKTQMD